MMAGGAETSNIAAPPAIAWQSRAKSIKERDFQNLTPITLFFAMPNLIITKPLAPPGY